VINESRIRKSISAKARSGVVRFLYEVDGRKYESDRVSTGSSSASVRDVPNYPMGARVTVYYDPADPELAVLEPGLRWESFIAAMMGLVIFGVWIVLVGNNSWKSFEPWLTARALQQDDRSRHDPR
jgi:hypothetical protein